MLCTLELNERQSARMLAQALQNQAKLELEPRPEICETLLWGSLVGQQPDGLDVTLHDVDPHVDIVTLLGAACDARTILTGQLYLFSTYIVDAAQTPRGGRLRLAPPLTVQVANRRRFQRRTPHEPVPIRLLIPEQAEPHLGHLANIALGGMACRVQADEIGELLLIGETIDVEFALPWTHEIFRLSTVICSKNKDSDPRQLHVGLEFATTDASSASRLEDLRRALVSETARLCDMNGDL